MPYSVVATGTLVAACEPISENISNLKVTLSC